MISHWHAHMERLGLSKSRFSTRQSRDKNHILSLQIQIFQMSKELHLLHTEYLQLRFSEEMQVALIHQASESSHPYSGLPVMVKFYLLDVTDYELSTADKWPTPGSRTTGMVSPTQHSMPLYSRQNKEYWLPLLGLASYGEIQPPGASYSWPTFCEEMKSDRWQKDLDVIISRCTHFLDHCRKPADEYVTRKRLCTSTISTGNSYLQLQQMF